MSFFLRVHGNLQGLDIESIEIKGPSFSIGRHPNCDFVLNDQEVSRLHADLRVDDEGNVYLADNGSVNGTFVNKVRLMVEQQLHDGDVIRICGVYLYFRESKPHADASSWPV